MVFLSKLFFGTKNSWMYNGFKVKKKKAKNDRGSITQLNYMRWLKLELVKEDEYRLKDNIFSVRGQVWYLKPGL